MLRDRQCQTGGLTVIGGCRRKRNGPTRVRVDWDDLNHPGEQPGQHIGGKQGVGEKNKQDVELGRFDGGVHGLRQTVPGKYNLANKECRTDGPGEDICAAFDWI